MSVSIITPYRSGPRPSSGEFTHVLRAEWIKFRSVRGWVIGIAVGALVTVVLALGPSMSGSCGKHGPASDCPALLGPGGEPVSDSFYFVHRPLDASGSITARVTSLTGRIPAGGGSGAVRRPAAGGSAGMRRGLVPWAKAGIIIKQNTKQGSAYAAMLVTGGHGVRMQYDYTHDLAGLPGAVSAASPRWLRLTRSGDTITGYDSADGTHWTKVGTAHLAGLASAVQAGLFATSPQYTQASFGGLVASGGLSQATGSFDHVSLQAARPAAGRMAGKAADRTAGWRGDDVGAVSGPVPGPATGFGHVGGRFTVTGTGDIAPAVSGASGDGGSTIAQTLVGAFAALIAVVVVATLFVTAEYRRGLMIRTTLAASPRRGQVLAAKAIVIGAVTLVAGLAAAAIAVLFGQRVLRGNGVYVYPATALTELRVIVGTAAVLAVCAVLALAIAAMLRRSAAAVATVIVVVVLPYLLAVVVPVLPADGTDWLARITPAAAFAVQQTMPQYSQVDAFYTPASGYYPLPPWAGFAVLCGYAALALALAAFLLRRRDA